MFFKEISGSLLTERVRGRHSCFGLARDMLFISCWGSRAESLWSRNEHVVAFRCLWMRVELYGQETLSAREMGEKGATLTISEHPHFAHHDSLFGNSPPNTYASLWIHRTLKFSAPWLKSLCSQFQSHPKTTSLVEISRNASWPLWSCLLISAKLWRREFGLNILLDNFLISELCVTATFMNRKEWLKVQSWWYSYLYSFIIALSFSARRQGREHST
jgi:hypothetical protein